MVDTLGQFLLLKTVVCRTIITAHKRSCGKVMFLHLPVILFTGGEGCHDVTSCYGTHLGRHFPRPPPPVNKRAVRILMECFLVYLRQNGLTVNLSHLKKAREKNIFHQRCIFYSLCGKPSYAKGNPQFCGQLIHFN